MSAGARNAKLAECGAGLFRRPYTWIIELLRYRLYTTHTIGAIITMAAVKPKADLIAQRLADRGRHIFFYNHIWTGQTVYSLDRTLNVCHLSPSTSNHGHDIRARRTILT